MAQQQLRCRQDLPPKGGYAGIRWEKNLPTRGISGVAMFLLCGGVMSAGFTLLIRHQRKRREWEREQLQSRLYLLPLLQAELDRRVLRGMKLFEEEEAQIMKDVKGWTVGESVYHTDRWIPPPAERLKSPEGAKSFGL